MQRTDPIYVQALARLASDMVDTFGEECVHVFGWSPAKTKSGGTKAVGNGPQMGKTLYGKDAARALAASKPRGKQAVTKEGLKKINPAKGTARAAGIAAAAKAKNGISDAPDLGALSPEQKAMLVAAIPKKSGVPTEQVYNTPNPPAPPADKPLFGKAARAAGRAEAARAEAISGVHGPDVISAIHQSPPPKLPPIAPAETKALDNYHAQDVKFYGPRTAKFLRGAAAAVRGLFTLGGLVTGTGLGAMAGGAIGTALGGPAGGALGTALGVTLGGGLGGLTGSQVRLPGALARAEENESGPIATRRAFGVKDNDKLPWPAQRRVDSRYNQPPPPATDAISAPPSPTIFTPGARGRAVARKWRRNAAGTIAGLGAGAPAAILSTAAPIVGAVGGGAAGGIPGAAGGALGGLVMQNYGYDAASRRASQAKQAVLHKLATSEVGRRKALRSRQEQIAVRGRKEGRMAASGYSEVIRLAEACVELFADSSDSANQAAYAKRQARGEKLAGYSVDVDYTRPMGGVKLAEGEGQDALPSNAVALIKVRIMLAARAAGVKLPTSQIPDEVVQKALDLAQQEETTDTLSECNKLAEQYSAKVGCFTSRRKCQ